jgi:hypothetical protein
MLFSLSVVFCMVHVERWLTATTMMTMTAMMMMMMMMTVYFSSVHADSTA